MLKHRDYIIAIYVTIVNVVTPGFSWASGDVNACLEKAFARYLKKIEMQELSAQRKLKRETQEAQARTNAKLRINWALKRTSDAKPLQPSEVRELRNAAYDLKKQGRADEADAIEGRVASHETRYLKSRKHIKLSPAQEQLIREKIKISPQASHQMEQLEPEVRRYLSTQIFLTLAENPHASGIAYKPAGFIEGIPTGKFKKFRFHMNTEYRVIFRVNSDGTVIVEAVANRENIYRGKFRALAGSTK